MSKLDLPEVLESSEYPLKWVRYRVDAEALTELMEVVGRGRERKFDRIVLCGGVRATVGRWRRNKVLTAFGDDEWGEKVDSMMGGYFDPKKREIVMYPEGLLEYEMTEESFRLQKAASYREKLRWLRRLYVKCRHEILVTLVEELEHGFQKIEGRHIPLDMRVLVSIKPVFNAISVFLAVFIWVTGWFDWRVLVLLAIPFEIVMLRTVLVKTPWPKWWVRMRYEGNLLEKEAKQVAVSIRLARLTQKAFGFDIKLPGSGWMSELGKLG